MAKRKDKYEKLEKRLSVELKQLELQQKKNELRSAEEDRQRQKDAEERAKAQELREQEEHKLKLKEDLRKELAEKRLKILLVGVILASASTASIGVFRLQLIPVDLAKVITYSLLVLWALLFGVAVHHLMTDPKRAKKAKR